MATPLKAIGQVEADQAAKKLYPNAGAATLKRQAYAALIAILNHAAARGWVNAPRIAGPKVSSKPPSWATPEYVSALLPHCSPRLRRFVTLIVYTGARLSEALRLDWDTDVDLAARLLTFRRTKNGKMRTAHIPDTLLTELLAVSPEDRHGLAFPWSHKSHVRRSLQNVAKRAGLPYLSPHKLGRHTYATWLRIYAKRDLKGLQEDGGRDSISSVARYAHVVPGETATAVDMLPVVQSPVQSAVKAPKDRKIRLKMK